MSLVVFCESQDGKIKKGSTELLTFAAKTGEPSIAILIGPNSEGAKTAGEFE